MQCIRTHAYSQCSCICTSLVRSALHIVYLFPYFLVIEHCSSLTGCLIVWTYKQMTFRLCWATAYCCEIVCGDSECVLQRWGIDIRFNNHHSIQQPTSSRQEVEVVWHQHHQFCSVKLYCSVQFISSSHQISHSWMWTWGFIWQLWVLARTSPNIR